ncbi:hypothetical protein NC651_019172 [Populus alba x Populus x berolinensis]|nr:hypothetical protein NC651_019172 [Populus alba x Populus x berolinensis]
MNVEINETDIISQMPEYIIQQIASFPPPIEVGSASVVPKALHHIWISLPIFTILLAFRGLDYLWNPQQNWELDLECEFHGFDSAMLSQAAPPKRKHNLALSKRDLCAALRLLMILFSLVSLCPSIENFVMFWCQGLKNLELSGLINLGDVEVLNILYLGENRECHIDLIACKKNIEVVKLC